MSGRDDVTVALMAPETQFSKSFLLPRAGRLFFKKEALSYSLAAA
jgi:hypothetical protein